MARWFPSWQVPSPRGRGTILPAAGRWFSPQKKLCRIPIDKPETEIKITAMETKNGKHVPLSEAAKLLGITDRALRWRITHGHALAIETVGGYVMTRRQIADAERRKPKIGRPKHD